MTGSTFRRALNYFSTYLLLVQDYVAFLGAKAIPIISGVIGASLLYPVPFAIMAAAVYAMLGGHQTSVISLHKWKFEIDVNSAFLYSLALAGIVLIFNYYMSRIALASTTAWQNSLLWRCINQLPVMARWDTEIAIPLPLRAARLGQFLNSVVRSGFLIGRIIAIGLSSLIIVVAALAVMTWLDPVSVGVLVLTALLFLPFYARSLIKLVGLRDEYAQEHQRQQPLFKLVLNRGILVGSDRRIDTSRLAPTDKRRFVSGYAVVNEMLQNLNLVGLLLGLHVVASIAIIYVINGANLSTFIRDKVVFFVVLIFMLRSALGLAMLMSRLSRNYTNLARLRAYLHPKRKRVRHFEHAPPNANFALEGKRGGRRFIQKNQPTFVVMPDATYAFELLPLSNKLAMITRPEPSVLRYIVLFGETELEALLDGLPAEALPAEIEISDDKQTLQLPVYYAIPDPDQLLVVALSSRAWDRLVQRGEVASFCAERIVFVIVSEPKRPKPPSSTTLLVVSDGADIIAVGKFAETWDDYAETAFQRATKEEVKLNTEEDDEM